MHPYLLLAIAIGCEVFATIALKATDGFSRFWPSVAVVAGYAVSFACLGFGLKAGLSLNVGYAIWSGAGTAIVAIAGVLLYQERIGLVGFLGIALIIAGVVVLHLAPSPSPEAAAEPIELASTSSVDPHIH